MAYLEVKTGIQKTLTDPVPRGAFMEVEEVYLPYIIVECYSQAVFPGPGRNERRSAGVLLWGFTEMGIELG